MTDEHTAIINPNLNLAIPAWINSEYFAEIVAKDVPNCVKILDCKPVAAIAPGENFTSIMLRIYLKLQLKDGTAKLKKYILKTMLDDDKGGSVIKDFDMFPKEMQMYQKYLLEFENLYKAAGRSIQFAPKCLFIEHIDAKINLVFEDLSEQQFVNTDRLNGFDKQHMRRVLHKLAEFHAVSAVYADKHGPYPNEFQSGFVTANLEEFSKTTFNIKLSAFKKAMATWCHGEEQKYIDKFPTAEQFWNCSLASLNTDPNAFNVLNHGDFWSSNVMFNYLPDGGINQVLFLDYQLCSWGSPAQDLLFFITISAAKDIRIKEFDHFVQIYHEQLVDCLKLLGYRKPLPKLRELQMAMYKENVTFAAFFALYNHLPVVVWPSDADSNLHSLLREDESGEEFRLRIFTNPSFVEQIRDILAFYHRRGVFNFEDF